MAIDINGIFNTISPIADKVFSSYANKGQVDKHLTKLQQITQIR